MARKVDVSILNDSTVLTDAEVQAAIPALQQQVSNDFAPVWGIDAQLKFVPSGTTPAPGTWWLTFLDNSDVAGALGYHDLTPDGLPLGKVFAQSDLISGNQWTATASHELLEMLADPEINLTVFVQEAATTAVLYAYEVCDACEADAYGYSIGSVLVSDFVYPAWFAPQGTGPFDHGRQINSPFELLPGGYIGVFDVQSGTGWHQKLPAAATVEYQMRPRTGSRRERRRTVRDHWLTSTAGSGMSTRAQASFKLIAVTDFQDAWRTAIEGIMGWPTGHAQQILDDTLLYEAPFSLTRDQAKQAAQGAAATLIPTIWQNRGANDPFPGSVLLPTTFGPFSQRATLGLNSLAFDAVLAVVRQAIASTFPARPDPDPTEALLPQGDDTNVSDLGNSIFSGLTASVVSSTQAGDEQRVDNQVSANKDTSISDFVSVLLEKCVSDRL